MDIITRNLFTLLRAGTLNECDTLEPMSTFKWTRLGQMVKVQHVEFYAMKGLLFYRENASLHIPSTLTFEDTKSPDIPKQVSLCNRFLNHRLQKIEYNERHAIDTNIGALEVMRIIVANVSDMLNKGIMLHGLLQLGKYLRTKGDKVDFEKLEKWLDKLHMHRMAQLQGCMLMEVFGFEQDELPFVQHIEPAAHSLVVRSVQHTANDTAEEWHFRQTRSGFVLNNSTLLRRNLKRSLRYIAYAPLETISNFINNFVRSLQEIEE